MGGRIFLEVGANSLKNVYHDELPLFPDAFLLSLNLYFTNILL